MKTILKFLSLAVIFSSIGTSNIFAQQKGLFSLTNGNEIVIDGIKLSTVTAKNDISVCKVDYSNYVPPIMGSPKNIVIMGERVPVQFPFGSPGGLQVFSCRAGEGVCASFPSDIYDVVITITK